MNILVYSWRDPKHPLAGGAEQVMHEHMKGWVEEGHSVTLFASCFKGSKREQNIDGINVIRRSFQYWGVHLAGAYYYLFGDHKHYDLVVDQFHGIPFFTPFYVRRAKKLAVLQEVAREVWLKNDLPSPLNKIIGWIGYLGEPLLFFPYRKTKFMVGSSSAKEDLSKMGIKKANIDVISHGVLIEKSSAGIKKEKIKTIVHLGALAKDKGVEDSLKTFSLLDKNGEYQFWIIGKGAPGYLRYLRQLTRSYKIDKKTKFWGFVSNKKKFELLKRAHVMINPSLLEGFGLVNIEANAMGIPVVGYTSRGLVDSIKNNVSGYIITPNTPVKLAQVVEKLIEDKARYAKLAVSSVKWSNNFSWKKSRKQSLELIESFEKLT